MDNDETMATAEQQAQQLASLQAKLGQEQEAEKSLRLQVERMEMERKALQREHDRLEREMADRKAKDPVIDHQIQVISGQHYIRIHFFNPCPARPGYIQF